MRTSSKPPTSRAPTGDHHPDPINLVEHEHRHVDLIGDLSQRRVDVGRRRVDLIGTSDLARIVLLTHGRF